MPLTLMLKLIQYGTSLVAQWLRFHAPNAGGLGSIPGEETRSQMPQSRVGVLQLKTPQDTIKTQNSQINNILKNNLKNKILCYIYCISILLSIYQWWFHFDAFQSQLRTWINFTASPQYFSTHSINYSSRFIKGWKVKVAQPCPTLCNPMDYTVHGILQARILEWVAFPFSRGYSQPTDQTQVFYTAGGFFTSWVTREAQEYWSG